VLERVFEILTASPPALAHQRARRIESISGQYRRISIRTGEFEIYLERAGQGVPILFLHTAGADSRQFHAQLSDVELGERFSMFAPDLPYHGRSFPPRNWNGEPYQLDTEIYVEWCEAILEQVIAQPAILVGGSMGAAISLIMAARRPDLLRGVVALEPPFKAKGRRNAYQHHAMVHGSMHNASFVRGLMSPTSPIEERRRAAWIYSQGAPGIYPGDLHFYSDEFDGEIIAPQIKIAAVPIRLLCGGYDYSATSSDGHRLARLISGSTVTIMPGLGHFPMCEHPDVFADYLLSALASLNP
jgi:pimeloyl-ACP methyl ester carboxylesterase